MTYRVTVKKVMLQVVGLFGHNIQNGLQDLLSN